MAKRKRKPATTPRATKPKRAKRTRPAEPTKPKKTRAGKPAKPAPRKKKPTSKPTSKPTPRPTPKLKPSPKRKRPTHAAPPPPVRRTPEPQGRAEKPSGDSGRRLSQSPDAKRARARRAELERARQHRNELARKRYRDHKAIAEAREIERQEKLEQRRRKREEERERKRWGGGAPPVDERTAAIGWLEHIRNRVAELFDVSLEITEAGGGHAELQGRDAQLASRTPWLVVGRFDPQDEIGYAELARALELLAEDFLLEASINPDRLSQIRIVFHDPRTRRGEGDHPVSRIGGWQFILGDLHGELVGTDPDDPDVDSLAARYDETRIPQFYIFFSAEITRYVSAWGRTQTITLR